MKISEILLYERINKNYSRKYVVDESGITEPTVAAYEYGRTIPQTYKLEDILHVYGLEMTINGVKQDISTYCKEKRKATGLSVKKFAKAAGTNVCSINHLENGFNVKLNVLINVLEYFGDKLVIDGMVVSNEYGLLE